MKNPLTNVLSDIASGVSVDIGDSVDRGIRLGCVAVAAQALNEYFDTRDLLDVAEEIYGWVNGE